MYCPNCGDEYREGFKVCFDCGAELVNDIPEENKVEHNSNLFKVVRNSRVLVIQRCWKVTNNRVFLKISSVSYKIFFVFLFLLNLFSIKYHSMWIIVPGWEIPANIVTPLDVTGKCALLSLLSCSLFFILGFKRYKLQMLINKIISIFWIICSLLLIFNTGYTENVSDKYRYLFFDFWWVALVIPLILLILLLYRDFNLNTIKNK